MQRMLAAAFVLPMITSAAAAENRAPDWYKHGAYVYRISTPDAENVLPHVEEGVAMAANLLDGSIPQITFLSGVIGHDHLGAWNWDGAWPYWNRVTFRANHSWNDLHGFMKRVHDEHNVYISFHVNLTDANVGLKDYPETREFFEKLVKAEAIYRRDWNPETNKRDKEPPYVPTDIPEDEKPVPIFALVDYKKFWDSGIGREMIDAFYEKLPYAPPLLYVDVLTPSGGNFSTGYPDGPLGGSQDTQEEGRKALVEYLRSKGTDVAAEGTHTMRQIDSTYGWLHGQGHSDDDYGAISGGFWSPIVEQVYGSAGGFNVSPIASTPEHLARVREHYAALLSGGASTKVMPGLDTAHVARRTGSDEFDIPGTGDPFRGDWADLVNNFYLICVQELYHVGKGNVRVSKSRGGSFHLDKCILASPAGKKVVVEAEEFQQGWKRKGALEYGAVVLEGAHEMIAEIAEPGDYNLKMRLNAQDQDAEINLYVNGEHLQHTTVKRVGHRPITGDWPIVDFGTVKLRAGVNSIVVDTGHVRAQWSDGTQALWTTPALSKGFKAWRDDVVFADDYDRMWPDTWSGDRKIYFFSWYGTSRAWRLPKDWSDAGAALLYPLTPDGRGEAVRVSIDERDAAPRLLPQVPYVLVPVAD